MEDLMKKCVNAHHLCDGGPCPYCEPVEPLRTEDGRFFSPRGDSIEKLEEKLKWAEAKASALRKEIQYRRTEESRKKSDNRKKLKEEFERDVVPVLRQYLKPGMIVKVKTKSPVKYRHVYHVHDTFLIGRHLQIIKKLDRDPETKKITRRFYNQVPGSYITDHMFKYVQAIVKVTEDSLVEIPIKEWVNMERKT